MARVRLELVSFNSCQKPDAWPHMVCIIYLQFLLPSLKTWKILLTWIAVCHQNRTRPRNARYHADTKILIHNTFKSSESNALHCNVQGLCHILCVWWVFQSSGRKSDPFGVSIFWKKEWPICLTYYLLTTLTQNFKSNKQMSRGQTDFASLLQYSYITSQVANL